MARAVSQLNKSLRNSANGYGRMLVSCSSLSQHCVVLVLVVVVVVNAAPWFCFILVWFEDDWCRAPWRRFGLGIILMYYIVAQKGPAKFGNEDGGILSNAPPAPPFLSVCVLDVLPTIFIHRPPRTLSSSSEEKEKKKRLSILGNRFFSSLALLWQERERERERGLAIPVARASFQKNSVIFVLVLGW